MPRQHFRAFLAVIMGFFIAMPKALADGIPQAWGLGLQPPGSPVETNIDHFHNNILLWVISAITLFVLFLLIFVIARYNRCDKSEAEQDRA